MLSSEQLAVRNNITVQAGKSEDHIALVKSTKPPRQQWSDAGRRLEREKRSFGAGRWRISGAELKSTAQSKGLPKAMDRLPRMPRPTMR